MGGGSGAVGVSGGRRRYSRSGGSWCGSTVGLGLLRRLLGGFVIGFGGAGGLTATTRLSSILLVPATRITGTAARGGGGVRDGRGIGLPLAFATFG